MDALLAVFIWWSVAVFTLTTGINELTLLTRTSIVLALTLVSTFAVEATDAAPNYIYSACHAALHSLVCRFGFELYMQASRAIDVFRGTQFSEQYLPGSDREMSVLERLTAPLLIVLALNTSLGENFLLMGFDFLRTSPNLEADSSIALAAAIGDSVEGALKIGLKVGLVLLPMDLVLGFTSRHLTGINITFESLPLRQLIGLVAAAGIYEAI